MKKCARCDFEYDDAYDGCPRCAKATVAAATVAPGVPAGQALSSGTPDYGPGSILGALLALPAFFVLYFLVGLFAGFEGQGTPWLTLFVSAAIVMVDAGQLKKPVPSDYKFTGNLGLSPAVWGLVVLAISIIALPWYAYSRPRIKRAYEIGAARLAASSAARPSPAEKPVKLGVLSGEAKLAGQAVYYSKGIYSLQNGETVGQQFVKMHHDKKQIAWESEAMRTWAVRQFGEQTAG